MAGRRKKPERILIEKDDIVGPLRGIDYLQYDNGVLGSTGLNIEFKGRAKRDRPTFSCPIPSGYVGQTVHFRREVKGISIVRIIQILSVGKVVEQEGKDYFEVRSDDPSIPLQIYDVQE